MAFKIGNAGFTSINREGKLSNMAQWPGDPIKMGHVDSDVTLDFNQSNTNFRLSFQPRRQTFFPGVLITRGNGYFANNIRNEIFYFKHDSGESFTTLRDYNDVKTLKTDFLGDYTSVATPEESWQENYYNISDPTLAIHMGEDYFALLRGSRWTAYDYNQPPLYNKRLLIFNYDFSLRKVLEDDDLKPVDYTTGGQSDEAKFGLTPLTTSQDVNLSSSGNRLAIPDYSFSENSNYTEGIIHIYNTDTLEYEQHIRAGDIATEINKQYINTFNGQPNLYPWYLGVNGTSLLLGYNGVKIEGNRLATFAGGADTALLLDLDSTNPAKPIFSVSMWDPAEPLDVGPGVSGYRDSNRADYNSFVKFDYRKGYYAMANRVLSPDSAEYMLNVLDSTGSVVFQYLSPNPYFGRNVHIAVDSDEPTGYIFVGNHITGSNSHYSGGYPDPNPKYDCLSIFRWNRDNIFIIDSAFKPSDVEARQFGKSIASDHRKDLLLIGAPHDSEGSLGAVYAYNYKSGTLTNEIKIYDSESRADGLTNELSSNPGYPYERNWTANMRFGNMVAANAYTDYRVEDSRLWNSLTLKKPTGLKDNVGQSGSILITKRTGDITGYTDSDGYFLADSCWWFPGGAEADSAKVLPGLTPSLEAKHPTKDLINYYVFDSDKIFCSVQRDLR